ncbi:LCP family protein [[Clostridium] polysaccharolyticum]|uniref:Transcriptional attenuator, LytR family n=1 Tax=[Clostridium] polysaccharolyticum TaxID=29364 RepID=A0A1I0AY08_9FIRM|nr:LCP family protein [[Clostridium] polysaccharolyticum]SES99291.1 transcriptional attenuator, LytR family [[Clostridium] polysaccharolyticum]
MEEKNTEPIAEETKTTGQKKKKIWKKPVRIVLILLLFLAAGAFIYSDYLLDKIHYDKDNERREEYFDEDEHAKDLDEVDPSDVHWQQNLLARHEDDVINILLVGEEAILDKGRGRTDSIMIATINVKEKSLKLTSIMRDLYLQIPGYSDNKINAAFNIGGMDLLVQALNQDFALKLDGYVKVDFDSFEDVIDALGGVEITLSAKEADYLNRTNYISNPAYRNVREGTQTLNGNQALGYSRVRYVAHGDQANDFGRTQRQRNVLNAIFQKYKSKSAVELIALLPDILSFVTTDLNRTAILEYLYLAVTLHPQELETMRIPVEEKYYSARIRGMAVLVPDTLQDNIDALQAFIFGDENADNRSDGSQNSTTGE